jgi:hypothetical protein
MGEWSLHWLEAQGDLSQWHAAIESEIAATRASVSKLLIPPTLDVLIERSLGPVIAEIGMMARAYRHSLFALSFDPDNPAFDLSLRDGTLRRTVAHEVNHCLRMAGPGYGATLGEALVSEGLAGHFVRRLFGSPPEPWERAVDTATLHAHLPDTTTLQSTQWDRAAWFFGTLDGRYPRWLGYTLGYELVRAWMEAGTPPDADGLVATPAADVIAVGLPRLAQVTN